MNVAEIPPPLANTLVQQLLPRGESRHMEFKRVSGNMVGKALETVCAFLPSILCELGCRSSAVHGGPESTRR